MIGRAGACGRCGRRRVAQTETGDRRRAARRVRPRQRVEHFAERHLAFADDDDVGAADPGTVAG